MSSLGFLDTNVLVYAYDSTNPAKRRVARGLLEEAVKGMHVISTQVLAEFAAAMLHRVTPRADPKLLAEALDVLAPVRLIVADGEVVRRAIAARTSYGLHFYDSMIVAAAERAGCDRLLSEDFNSGQSYFGITAENPFR
jgi:predicted nucleic acid-binding protein